ncbi:twin-arginine translocase subunit TatC [Paeniglutamicibacter cryotolerans]|uniref:Sec-independent protein translocase protein TatC n=1 Tax=Paeniglutamicibacter cryotolerans TaxID=670079 RepID=A0A839QN95_9MICC|nr:twin-arginine translocase subunit TatC [Paeniglutamicibacter cryotolerans]MBB2997240.1 sec-independent protein translocase protein TatC [Paeniglutamicibacter cryotolerans]
MTEKSVPSKGRKSNPEGRMALKAHLIEARNRLFISLGALLVATIGGFFLYQPLMDLLIEPVKQYSGEVNYTAVMTSFDMMIKISLFLGLAMSSPVWIYQLWAFIVPGLKKKERAAALGFAAAAVPLFLMGLAMAVWVIPHALKFFFMLTPQNAVNIISVEVYIPFVLRLMLAFGLAMLVPVLMVGLNMIGILPARLILKNWRLTVFLIALVSAMAAPGGDAITMFALAGPLFITFGGATLICFFNDRKRAKNKKITEAETEANADIASDLGDL